MTAQDRPSSFDVQRMSLYSLTRAERVLDALTSKDRWQPEDTASFDCMHYLGDAAIDECAKALQLQSGDDVVDIGSGFNATGRYLNRYYGVNVKGVELQSDIHAMAVLISARNGQAAKVQSVNTNFITAPETLIAPRSADHITSFLCILHIADRKSLFERMAQTLKPGGQIYLEDYYARRPLNERDVQELDDVVSCPYLPSQEVYIEDLRKAGFQDVTFEDISGVWTSHTKSRAETYHGTSDRDRDLDVFYTTVAGLFSRGNLGGARIRARIALSQQTALITIAADSIDYDSPASREY